MLDIQTRIAQLRRPNLLIKAARFGLDDYVRSAHLRRILEGEPPLKSAAVLVQLLDSEHAINNARIQKDTTYSAARHIDVLIAIMSEAQIYRACVCPT
jgi:hypothetical protein